MTTTLARQQQRRRTTAGWAADVEPLLAGEEGVDTDSGVVKIGPGLWAAARVIGKGTAAADITFAPASGIAATDAQAAIVEARADAIAAIPAFGTTAGTAAQGNDPRFGDVTRPPYQFHVDDFGAVGDNATSDDAAIRATIDAAVAYATDSTPDGTGSGEYYAEVLFGNRTYVLSGAMQDLSGTLDGNNTGTHTQIPLPAISQTGRKLVLVLRSEGHAAASHVFFKMTEPHRSGATIRSTLTGQTVQVVNGLSIAPSIIGGRRVAGSNNWSNLHVVVDGLTIAAPHNPSVVGLDIVEVATCHIGQLSVHAYAPVVAGSPPLLTTAPSDSLGLGVQFPETGNNDQVYVDNLDVFGFYTGCTLAEHSHINRLAVVYGRDAVFVNGPGNWAHGITIDSLSVEQCVRGFVIANSGGFSIPLNIGAMHGEIITGNDVDDPGGRAKGVIRWHSIAKTAPAVSAGVNLRVLNERITLGVVVGTVAGIAPPAVPASGSPLVNPYFRDWTVFLTAAAGGATTITQIDGVALTTPIVIGASQPGPPLRIRPSGSVTFTYGGGNAPTFQGHLS